MTFTGARFNNILISIVLTCIVLYYGRGVLIPVTFSVFFAMLLFPVARYLEKKGWNRIFSSLASVFILLLALGIIITITVIQANSFSKELPQIQQKLQQFLSQLQHFAGQELGLSDEQVLNQVEQQSQAFINTAGSALQSIGRALITVTGGMALSLVFTYLFLYQREKYENVVMKLYKGDNPGEMRGILREISKVSQHYLTGRLISILILLILYTVGLMIAGLKNAFLLSLVAALLTIIPYIGTTIGGLLPVLMALITGTPGTAWGALIIMVLVQALDNYLIEPYVMEKEVNVSAFFSILILFAGGLIWGIAGMILFIPLLGVLKIIFDHIPSLQPLGYLIGDEKQNQQSDGIWKKLKKMFKKI